jgi:hypothetical protein
MMPTLDVSSVLLSPEFCDTRLKCIRSSQTVGDDGIAVNTTQTTRFSGVVTADSGLDLRRDPEGSRVTGTISIITMFFLQDGKSGEAADIVCWQGRQYTVIDVQDYSRYGRGFIEAKAELIPVSGGR